MKKLLLIGFIFFISFKLYSQWISVNPFPTQNGLSKMYFANQSTGMITGYYGTYLKTTNSGLNWTVTDIGISYDITCLNFLNSQTGWLIAYYNLYKTTNGGSNWSLQNPVSYYYNDVKFINSQTGYGVNTNGLYRTSNGGSSWVLYLANNSFKCIFFANERIGWVAGDAGKIFKTSNSGVNWVQQTTNQPNVSLINAHFSDSISGYIMCSTNSCFMTSDGGNNWNFRNVGNYYLNSVYFLNSQTGWISGYGVITRTSNAGISWEPINFTKNIYAVRFTDGYTGFAAGQDGTILKSTDGGNTWVMYNNSFTTRNLLHISFTDQQTGYILNDTSQVMKTTDGGSNWYNTSISNSKNKSMCFINSNTGWLAGDSGKIFKTTNGGINWLNQISGSYSYLRSVFFVNDQTGWVSGGTYNNSIVLKTTNGGINWINQNLPSSYGINSSYFVNDQTGWVVGYIGIIYKTTNGGSNWINQLTNPATLYSVTFKNSQTGWAAGEGRDLLKTTDGGNNWMIYSIAANASSVRSVFFIDYNTGYLAGWGFIFRTSNGGINWVQQNSLNYNLNNSVYFINQFTGFIVGEKGKIIKTTNGGSVFVSQTGSQVSSDFSLSQNYPNPFNPFTNIRYQIPDNRFVTLKIFDILGKEIEMIVNEKQSAGTYEVRWDGSNYPSGVYFYRLEARNFTETRKMVLIK